MPEKQTIKGTVSDTPIDIYYYPSKKPTSAVAVVTKGMYGVFDPDQAKDTVCRLTKRLVDTGTSHVVVHNSSRVFSYGRGADYGHRQKAFLGKTFSDVFEDLKTVIQTTIGESADVFGVSHSPNIYLHGTSLGATLSALATKDFSIQKLSLCAPPMGTNGSDKPLLSTFPDSNILKKTLGTYDGELLVFRGGADEVVPEESVRQAYKAANRANRTYKEIPEVNHNFSEKNGKESGETPTLFTETVFDFFQN